MGKRKIRTRKRRIANGFSLEKLFENPQSTESKTYYINAPKITQVYIYPETQVSGEVRSLKERVKELEELHLSEELAIPVTKLVILKPTLKKKAKKEILHLIRKVSGIGYGDIAQKIGLNLQTVVGICAELEKESKIEPINS